MKLYVFQEGETGSPATIRPASAQDMAKRSSIVLPLSLESLREPLPSAVGKRVVDDGYELDNQDPKQATKILKKWSEINDDRPPYAYDNPLCSTKSIHKWAAKVSEKLGLVAETTSAPASNE